MAKSPATQIQFSVIVATGTSTDPAAAVKIATGRFNDRLKLTPPERVVDLKDFSTVVTILPGTLNIMITVSAVLVESQILIESTPLLRTAAGNDGK